MRKWATLFWLATVGCLAALAVPLPELGPEAQTLIVHIRSDGAERIWVSSPDHPAPMPESIIRDDARIRAHTLAYSPAALQLPLGLQRTEAGSRALPSPLQSWQGEVSGGALQWKPTAPDPTRDTFGLPPLDWALCLEQEGCAPAIPDDFTYCSQVCEGTSPAPPAPPSPPQGMAFVAQGVGETLSYRTPLPAAQACLDGEAQAYGDAECAPVGPCAEGWPAPAATGTTWYVEHGGTGVGTPEAPFPTVAAALNRSRPGDTILIGAGDYVGPQILQGPVTIRGRCSAQTSLQGGPAMQLSGQGLVISDLRLPEVTVIGGTVHLLRVTWLDLPSALSQSAGELTVTDALAQRIARSAFVISGGDLTMTGVVVDRAIAAGILCNARTHCNLRRTVVRNFGDPDVETPSPAVYMDGATFGIREFIIEDGAADGLIIADAATGTAAVGLIRNLVGSEYTGRAITVRQDAQLDVRDLFVSRVSTGGIELSTQAIVYARDIVILDTQRSGAAFVLRPSNTQLRVERAYVNEERRPLLEGVKRANSFAELTDIRYLSGSTAPAPFSIFGFHDGQATLRRAHLTSSGSTVIDMVANLTASTLSLIDVRTEGGAEALRIDTEVTVRASRAHFSGVVRRGIGVPRLSGDGLGSYFSGEDITIEMVGSDGLTSQGTAVEVGQYGQISMKRFAVRGAALIGVEVRQRGTLQLTDGTISGPELGLRIHENANSDVEAALRKVRIGSPRQLEVARD